MRLSTIGYCIKQGTINLYKNHLMSMASVGTISTCILVIGIFYMIAANVEYSLDKLQNKFGIEVFFVDSTAESDILALKSTLEQDSRVYSITYTSAEQAWEYFKTEYLNGDESFIAGFEENNPLKNSASLTIYLSDISEQPGLVASIKTNAIVRNVVEEPEVTNTVQVFSDFIKYASIILIAVLAVFSMFLISNTVRLAIELRKTEINIMKYIGATDTFIRGPFLIEGLVIGLLGVVLPLILIFSFYDNIISVVVKDFGLLQNYIYFMSVSQIAVKLIPLCMLIGAGIGVLGSMMTIHKHLRV